MKQRWSKAQWYLIRNDPVIAKIAKDIGNIHFKSRKGHYKSLVRSIISQQISSTAARTIHKKFIKIVGSRFIPQAILQLPQEHFRSVGLSPQKITYILALSQKIHSKEINIRKFGMLSDEEIIEQLTSIKGIGRWTAQMFLIFSLNRPDVLPLDDLGVKKGMMKSYHLMELPSKETMEKIAEKWKPYRSLGSWYMWRSLDSKEQWL